MSIPNTTMIAMSEAGSRLKESMSLTEMLNAAMDATVDHWIVLNEDEQFKAAIGAVLLKTDQPTRDRISSEMKALAIPSAAQAGIPVDFARAFEEMKEDAEPIGLLEFWREAKKRAGR